MTVVDDFLATAATTTAAPTGSTEPPRDRWGRYLLSGPGMTKPESHTRATTMARTLADTFNLDQWGRRMLLQGASKRPDLVALAATLDPEERNDKAQLNKLADQCQEAAAASSGANYGTAVHAFTAKLDAGDKVVAPPPLDRDLAAYASTLAERGIRTVPQMIERVVSLQIGDARVAGTLDRANLVDRPGWDLPVIGDVKTAKEIWSFGEIAIQLALYANADLLHDIPSGTYAPMPAMDKTRGLVFHLPVGRAACTVYVVDLVAGWEAVQLALDVRRYRDRTDLAVPFDMVAASAPAAPAGDDLMAQLEQSLAITASPASSSSSTSEPAEVDGATPADPAIVDWLRACVRHIVTHLDGRPIPPSTPWPATVPTFKLGGPTTVAECAAVEAWCREVGKAAQLPFGPDRPRPDFVVPDDLLGMTAPTIERPTTSTTPAADLDALKARFQAVQANDLREAATARARELGVADVARLDADRLAVLRSVIVAMEAAWAGRREHVAKLTAGWQDPELQLLIDIAAPPIPDDTGGSTRHWTLDELEAEHVAALEVVLDLENQHMVLAFDYEQADVRLQVDTGKAIEVLVAKFGGKQPALTAAREAAKATGAPGPRAVTDVAGNPGLLVATLRRGAAA